MIKKDRKGNLVIYASVEVDINETVDADVCVDYKQFIKSLDDDDKLEISKSLSLQKPLKQINFNGEELKRHLCDIVSVSYHTPINQIISELVFKLNS